MRCFWAWRCYRAVLTSTHMFGLPDDGLVSMTYDSFIVNHLVRYAIIRI